MDLQDFIFAGNRLALSWGKAVKIGSGPFILPTAKAPPLPPLPPPISLPIPTFPLPAAVPTAMSVSAANSASAAAIDAFLAPLPLTSPLLEPSQAAYNITSNNSFIVAASGGSVSQLEAPPVFTPPPPALPFLRPPRTLHYTTQ